MVQTVVKKEEKTEKLVYQYSSLDDNNVVEFTIQGQTCERSFEDRSVYFAMKSGNTDPISEGSVGPAQVDFSMWLQGEDAIAFGVKLIEHGKFALESNMINHQLIHMGNNFRRYLTEERIEEVCFEVIDDAPNNYGGGYRTYSITPIWNEGMAPEYDENFFFEKVIHWSPFEEEYQNQLDYYTNGCSYSFVGYDHDEEVRKFNEEVQNFSRQ
ncbi:MAG: hypothetical protein KQ78_02185 [Candidatus Izimaplasma bacterium HR2]|nr:MAG: hypothetical protein KQ78_02185 [Candidatus Izimaplasma bacterium HR2]